MLPASFCNFRVSRGPVFMLIILGSGLELSVHLGCLDKKRRVK